MLSFDYIFGSSRSSWIFYLVLVDCYRLLWVVVSRCGFISFSFFFFFLICVVVGSCKLFLDCFGLLWILYGLMWVLVGRSGPFLDRCGSFLVLVSKVKL